MVRGKFITFEGIEGCGKTTQVAMLLAYLRETGRNCLATKEPGGSAIGLEIRSTLLHTRNAGMTPACEALLYLADRAQHVAEVVNPNLNAGTWVIGDRYQDSTQAYQGAARGLDPDQLDAIFRLATGGLKPDLTILLDLDAATGLARAQHRNIKTRSHQTEGRFEAEHIAFHETVRACYLKIAAEEPLRFAILKADRPPETIAQDICALIESRWKANDV